MILIHILLGLNTGIDVICLLQAFIDIPMEHSYVRTISVIVYPLYCSKHNVQIDYFIIVHQHV